jgi:hypothetical protein
MPIRVLFDTGVFIHSEFAEFAVNEIPVRWVGMESVAKVHGLRRKQPHADKDYQSQIDALFTVGRMIREGRVEAYTYNEIRFERFNGRPELQEFNALQGCSFRRCDPPLDRSLFLKTSNFKDFFAKGGKKDRGSGLSLGDANQIAFFDWLCTLDKASVGALIKHSTLIGLSDFEINSLRNIEWFQLVCNRSGTSENYPDVFHLWTAERHHLDAFLTLEKKLPRLVDRVRNEKTVKIAVSTDVLRPLDLLQRLGVCAPDPVPIDEDRFYDFYRH